jgi:hypothetical protein
MVCDNVLFQSLIALEMVDGLLVPIMGLMASIVGIWPVSEKKCPQAS